MKIYYDSNLVCTLNPLISTSPYIEVDDSFNLTKTVSVIIGQRQKENSQGFPLFIKDIFSEREVKEVVGYSDTTKKVDSDGNPLEPLIILVQKENDDCEKLYYKTVECNGGFSKIETTEETDEPVMIEAQKVTPSGRPVYKLPIIRTSIIRDKVGEEEVTEDTGKVALENILEEKEVNLANNPSCFTIQEVIAKKYEDMLKEYGKNIIYKEFIDLNDVSLFSGNTGLGFVQMSPKSKIKFKTIAIEGKCNAIKLLEFLGDSRIEVSVGGRILKGEEIRLKDNNNLKQMTLTLSNNTDDYLTINRIAVLAYFKEPTKEEKLTARLNNIESTMTQMQSAIDEVILGVM